MLTFTVASDIVEPDQARKQMVVEKSHEYASRAEQLAQMTSLALHSTVSALSATMLSSAPTSPSPSTSVVPPHASSPSPKAPTLAPPSPEKSSINFMLDK